MQQYMAGTIAQHFRVLHCHPQNLPAQISFFSHAYVSYLLGGLLLDNTTQMKDAAMFLYHAVQDSAKREITARLSPFRAAKF